MLGTMVGGVRRLLLEREIRGGNVASKFSEVSI